MDEYHLPTIHDCTESGRDVIKNDEKKCIYEQQKEDCHLPVVII